VAEPTRAHRRTAWARQRETRPSTRHGLSGWADLAVRDPPRGLSVILHAPVGRRGQVITGDMVSAALLAGPGRPRPAAPAHGRPLRPRRARGRPW